MYLLNIFCWQWKISTFVTTTIRRSISFYAVFCFQAGNYVRDDTVPSLIHMVASSDNLQAYAVQQLFLAVQDDISQVCTNSLISLVRCSGPPFFQCSLCVTVTLVEVGENKSSCSLPDIVLLFFFPAAILGTSFCMVHW